MRIGLDARELQGRATGVGRYLGRLLESWPAADGDIVIAYFNGPAPRELPACPARLEARGVGARPARGLVWQELRLPAAARADRLDVFFAPAYACPLRLRAPRVTTVHDLSFFAVPHDFTPLDAARRRALTRLSVRASRRLVTVSDFTRRELAAFVPESVGRVATIPHGADPAASPGLRERARDALGVRGPLLLSVGSILNRRRLPELLHAVARTARRHPGLVLDVVGENRTHPRLDVQLLVDTLGLTRQVRLSGFLSDDDLRLRYAAADLAVYLSDYEGFGIPVLEAMAHGLPVITSERPATGEIFAGAARLVDPGDVGAIADAVGALVSDGGERSRLVARGMELAARHSWREAASRTRAVLAEAAAS
jgi:glycosyltransferase involved in cell wall biosynthesis